MSALEINAIRSCFAIIAVCILSIVATSYQVDGELIKLAILSISALGGAEVVLEYWYGRKRAENGGT